MAPTATIATGIAAVAAPVVLGGLVNRIPGGAVGIAVVGAGLIWAGTKQDGLVAAALIGAGAGFIANAALGLLSERGVSLAVA